MPKGSYAVKPLKLRLRWIEPDPKQTNVPEFALVLRKKSPGIMRGYIDKPCILEYNDGGEWTEVPLES